MTFTTLDWAIIAAYFVASAAIGLFGLVLMVILTP